MTTKPRRGAVHQLLERAHSPDTANQIFTDKIQYREQFLRPVTPDRDGLGSATAALAGTETETTTGAPKPPLTTAAHSLAAAAAAAVAAETAALGASGHNGREARRRARRLKQEQSRREAQKLKPKPLSARQRKLLKLYDVPTQAARGAQNNTKKTKNKALLAGQSYSTFVPLHRLWLGYIREVLGPQELRQGGAAAAAKLTAADFHGALVEVTRSACVGRVGTRGIVVRDTRFVFEIVTPANELRMVPKEGTFFRFEIPVEGDDGAATGRPADGTQHGPATAGAALCDGSNNSSSSRSAAKETPKLVVEILGSQFMHRAADRANRKFKQHFYKEL